MVSSDGAMRVSEGHWGFILSQQNTVLNYERVLKQEAEPSNQAELSNRTLVHGITEHLKAIPKSATLSHTNKDVNSFQRLIWIFWI